MTPEKARRVRGSGSLFRKPGSRTWTIQYYKDGTNGRVRVREATGETSQKEAQKILTRRLDQIDRGEPVDVRRSVRIGELFEALKEHNQVHSRRGSADVEGRWRHLSPVFRNQLAASLTRRYPLCAPAANGASCGRHH
jgi:hypothetical protein